MKRVLAVLCLVAALALSVYAQPSALKANIPFEFTVGSNTLPAGIYEFTIDKERTIVTLRNMESNKTMIVPVITALAVGSARDVKVTFDAVGADKMLEAVWPADDDGVLLQATKGKHSHEIVKVAAKE